MRDDHLLSLCMIYLYILIHLVEEPLLVLGLNDDDIFMSQAETKKSSIVNTLNYFNYGKRIFMSDVTRFVIVFTKLVYFVIKQKHSDLCLCRLW